MRWLSCFVTLAVVAITTDCEKNMAQNNSANPKRDVNEVLRDHDKELLAIPAVVGVERQAVSRRKTPKRKLYRAQKIGRKECAIPGTLERQSTSPRRRSQGESAETVGSLPLRLTLRGRDDTRKFANVSSR